MESIELGKEILSHLNKEIFHKNGVRIFCVISGFPLGTNNPHPLLIFVIFFKNNGVFIFLALSLLFQRIPEIRPLIPVMKFHIRYQVSHVWAEAGGEGKQNFCMWMDLKNYL